MMQPQNPKWVDLHLHTNRSDGTLSPAEVVELAHCRSIAVISITDHDTVAGVRSALEAGRSLEMQIIPGVEISARFPGGSLHLLGYGIDLESQILIDGLNRLRSSRRQRNRNIITRLAALGIDITDDPAIIGSSSTESIGRPHIAAILVRHGVVPDFNTAFDRYLGKNGLAYFSKEVFSASETIKIIKESGGLAFLAHPATLNLDPAAFRAYAIELKEQGLDGIEVYSSAHSPEQIVDFRDCCRHYGFLLSGGSDFHGGHKNGVDIGICNAGQMIEVSSLSSALLSLT
jgi:3',5'-nucleoside bisphosphate phosphatase